MAIPDRIYERTEAGLKALLDPGPALPAEMRSVLSLVKTRTHADVVSAGTRNYPPRRVAEALAELEKLGFVRSSPATAEHDLDFTGGYAPLKI